MPLFDLQQSATVTKSGRIYRPVHVTTCNVTGGIKQRINAFFLNIAFKKIARDLLPDTKATR